MLNVIVGALAKNGSFGFAKGRLVCRASTFLFLFYVTLGGQPFDLRRPS